MHLLYAMVRMIRFGENHRWDLDLTSAPPHVSRRAGAIFTPGTLTEGAALVAARAEKKKGPMVNTISPHEDIPDTRLYSSGSESEEEEGGRGPGIRA